MAERTQREIPPAEFPLHERLRQRATPLPSDVSAVTLTRADLLALIEDSSEAHPANARDMTVEEVAEETRRAPSTIRGWLIAGELEGYKLNGRDWRITRAALRAYLEDQGGADESPPAAGDVDIGAWRKVRGEGGSP
jgi:excisionase family DNA binding protein